MLLTDNRIKVNTQDMDGWTALMWACEYKFVDVVKSLLEKGADPHLRDRVCGAQNFLDSRCLLVCFLR